MKYIIGVVALVLVIGLVWFFGFRETVPPEQFPVDGNPERVTNDDQNFEFTYYKGPEGYTMLESSGNSSETPLQKVYTLVATDRYIENDERSEGIGQTIPMISVMVFNKEDAATTTEENTGTEEAELPEQTIEEWARENSGFTAFNLATMSPEEVRIDGVRGIRYTAEGPFASEVYVLENRGKYYVFLGQYEEESSDIRTAFRRLMTEIFFL